MRLVDFDDTLMGPVVQDFWLFLGADPRSRLPVFLEGYEEFSSFDIRQIRWIEALRLLRFVHYTAWVARRWTDPSFPRAFPHFGTESYWAESTDDLERQLRKIQTDFETTQFHAQ
jgi:Ser/Thr protein kinase RdoA (MazF antagonist)